jgi:hypothetical protein
MNEPKLTLRALLAARSYLDYNEVQFAIQNDEVMQEAFATALAPLTGLQAIGLSHMSLEAWPRVLERLPRLVACYLGASQNRHQACQWFWACERVLCGVTCNIGLG